MAYTYNPNISATSNKQIEAYNRSRVPDSEGTLGLRGSTQTRGADGKETSVSQYGPDPEDEYALKDKYNKQAEDRFMGYVNGPDTAGTTAPAAIPYDETGARNAAFARAKEQSGAIARSSLTGLRNSMARRGISGGGYAEMKGAEALAPAADRVQDFTREQLMQDLNRSAQVSDRERGAGLTERGQNMSARQSLLGLLRSGGIY